MPATETTIAIRRLRRIIENVIVQDDLLTIARKDIATIADALEDLEEEADALKKTR